MPALTRAEIKRVAADAAQVVMDRLPPPVSDIYQVNDRRRLHDQLVADFEQLIDDTLRRWHL